MGPRLARIVHFRALTPSTIYRRAVSSDGSSFGSPAWAEQRRLSARAVPRRSMLYIPGSSQKMLAKSITVPADTLCYDLEDSVAIQQKVEAREHVYNALNADAHADHELLVRVNSRQTGMTEEDLRAVMPSDHIDGIVLPKVTTADDIHWAEDLIQRYAQVDTWRRMRIIASIESALAMINLRDIVEASPRIDALLFGAEDFCADTNISRTSSRQELLYTRSALVMAGRAYGIGIMDLVCVDLQHTQILEEECLEAQKLGFTSKQAIHPKQVEAINKAFSPTKAAIERAVAILEQNDVHTASGKGAFSFSESDNSTSVMIDAPMILQAQEIIKRAESLGLPVPWSHDKSLKP